MAIVNYQYYVDTYMGEAVSAAEFARLETRAEQVIDAACRGAYTKVVAYLTAKGFTSAAADLTAAYSNAICAQIEYFQANGVLATMTGQSGGGFSVGKVRVDAGQGASFALRGAAMLSPAATMFLEQTGLLSRNVAVPCEPFAPFPVGWL